MTLQQEEENRQELPKEQKEIDNLFSKFEEDTDTINQNLEKSAKLEHEIGLECWCYKNRGYDHLCNNFIQSIELHGWVCGLENSKDGSIFCWLCMLDEYDTGIPIHHNYAPMHTNKEFSHHILFEHIEKGKTWSKYMPHLVNLS